MRVRLLTRRGSRMQGDVASVSEERAKALEAEGIAKILEVDVPSPLDGVAEEDELEAIKAQLVLLGMEFKADIALKDARKLLKKSNK